MDPDQPANAIVNFVLKMIAAQKQWAPTANPFVFFVMPSVIFFPFNHRHLLSDLEKISLWFDAPPYFSCSVMQMCVCVCVCVCVNERGHDRVCVVCLCACGLHACALLLGRTPEWTRGSAGWGVAVCDNGTGTGGGGGDFILPGRVTREQEEGMTWCVQLLIFFSNCFIFIFLRRRRRSQVEWCKGGLYIYQAFDWSTKDFFLKKQSGRVQRAIVGGAEVFFL